MSVTSDRNAATDTQTAIANALLLTASQEKQRKARVAILLRETLIGPHSYAPDTQMCRDLEFALRVAYSAHDRKLGP